MPISMPAPNERKFCYQPLSQDGKPTIRLLQWLEHDGTKEYSLSVYELNGAPQYCALSYVWGAENASEWIVVNGKVLAVRPNLASALNQLRKKAQPRCMWIDAVCIDQTNFQERNCQVKIMEKIYRQAERVYVWFGSADAESDLVMQPDFASQLPKSIHEAAAIEVAKVKESLFTFAQRSWWDRIWVVQECVFARDLVALCGEHIVAWSSLVSNLRAGHEFLQTSWATAIPDFKTSEHDRLAAMIKAVHFAGNLSDFLPDTTGEHMPLLIRLNTLRQRKSTDPRDKVFATLALVSPRAQELLNIDYALDLPVLYTNTAMVILNLTNELDFLSACEPASPRSDIPSWVPDWSDTRTQAHTFIGLAKLAPFAAGGDMKLQAEAHISSMQLKLKGKFWDTVTFAFPLSDVAGDTGLTALFVCVLIFIVLQRGNYVGVDFTHAFVNALSAGVVSEGGKTRQRTQTETHLIAEWIESTVVVQTVREETSLIAGNSSQMSKYFNATAKNYSNGVSNPSDFRGEEAKYRSGVEEWYSTSLFTRPSRALFVTKQHKLVLGGIAAKRGDSVFIPAGSRVPVAVRRLDDGCYQFIGECYSQGIMSGQAMRETTADDLESIVLR